MKGCRRTTGFSWPLSKSQPEKSKTRSDKIRENCVNKKPQQNRRSYLGGLKTNAADRKSVLKGSKTPQKAERNSKDCKQRKKVWRWAISLTPWSGAGKGTGERASKECSRPGLISLEVRKKQKARGLPQTGSLEPWLREKQEDKTFGRRLSRA